MNNLLIVEDSLIQSHFLINSICREFQNVKLYGVVTTGIEAIDIIKEEKVDLIILDLKLSDMSGIDVINFITKNNISKYKSSIIVITSENKLLEKIIKNEYVFSYCSKTNNINFITTQIKKLLTEKRQKYYNNSIESKIKTELENLKFNFSYIGVKYLQECIYQCYYKKNIYSINLNKDIYPAISKKYNKTINAIRTSIFQATSIMYYENDEQYLSEYFGYKLTNKPTTKDIIYIVLQKIINADETY